MNLTDKELMSTKGGGVSYGLIVIIGGALTFIAGVIDGILRPLSCNKKK